MRGIVADRPCYFSPEHEVGPSYFTIPMHLFTFNYEGASVDGYQWRLE